MILMPDPNTAVIDPFLQHKTLILNCFVRDPVTGESYSRDPRYIAKKAEEYLRSTGIADTAYFGPEAEFYVFNDVRFMQDQRSAFYQVDSVEGSWNTARDEGPNLGYKPRYKEGYFPVPPMDHYQDLRSEMILTMERLGDRDRGPAPRGRHRRPGRDRHALRHAAGDGRQADALQVRRQERRPQARPVGDVHAQADLPGQRLRHARAPVAVEGRRAAVLRRGRLRRAVRHGPLVHRRPAHATPRRSSPSPPRRRTATSGWCPATRRRSTSSTASATARRACASRSTRRARRPSGSSSAAPTRRATRTWPSRRC